LQSFLAKFGSDSLDPHANRPWTCPLQPQRIGHRNTEQLRLKMTPQFHGIICNRASCLTRPNSNKYPFDHRFFILGVFAGIRRSMELGNSGGSQQQGHRRRAVSNWPVA